MAISKSRPGLGFGNVSSTGVLDMKRKVYHFGLKSRCYREGFVDTHHRAR